MCLPKSFLEQIILVSLRQECIDWLIWDDLSFSYGSKSSTHGKRQDEIFKVVIDEVMKLIGVLLIQDWPVEESSACPVERLNDTFDQGHRCVCDDNDSLNNWLVWECTVLLWLKRKDQMYSCFDQIQLVTVELLWMLCVICIQQHGGLSERNTMSHFLFIS